MKKCTHCGLTLHITEFHTDNSRPDKLHPQCKACVKQNYLRRRKDPKVVAASRKRSRDWRLANPERSFRGIRCATLRKKYGISADDFDELFARQGKVCAICGGADSKGYGQMHVDHNHETGKIRAILCQACNVTLGKVNEDPILLRKMAEYLEKYR